MVINSTNIEKIIESVNVLCKKHNDDKIIRPQDLFQLANFVHFLYNQLDSHFHTRSDKYGNITYKAAVHQITVDFIKQAYPESNYSTETIKAWCTNFANRIPLKDKQDLTINTLIPCFISALISVYTDYMEHLYETYENTLTNSFKVLEQTFLSLTQKNKNHEQQS